VVVCHGSTVATNAVLERKVARVAFLITKGFEDTIVIGRQARPELYDWFQPVPKCLVPRQLRFGIAERVGSKGELLRAIDPGELETIAEAIANAGVEVIAVSTLFSFANTDSEKKITAALEPLVFPCLSLISSCRSSASMSGLPRWLPTRMSLPKSVRTSPASPER
jgi:N-methylhydantoinase A